MRQRRELLQRRRLRSQSAQALALLALMISATAATFFAASASDNRYTLQIDLPPEAVSDVIVNDTLPCGLIYMPESLSISGAAIDPNTAISSPDDGSKPVSVTWTFGDVNNTADQDLTISFKAVVADIPTNLEGAILAPSMASLSWKDAAGVVHTVTDESKSVKLIEPDLEIERQFDPSSGWREDEVSCLLSLCHALGSTADAYDTDVLESFPKGLSYIPGTAEILSGPEDCQVDASDSHALHWYCPKMDRSWSRDQKILLRYRAKIDDQVMANDSLSCNANLSWASAPTDNPDVRHYERTSESGIMLVPRQPDLKISLADIPDPVRPGNVLNYTIRYLNRGGAALGTAVEANYDTGVDFISADPAPDAGANNRWTIGVLRMNESGTIKVSVRAGASLSESSTISTTARISSDEGSSVQVTASTKVSRTAPSLFIEKTASSPVIMPGGTLNYTIAYENRGTVDSHNVNVTDIVDSNLIFEPGSVTPQPSEVWTDREGTHLLWNASALGTGSLKPGDGGEVDFKASLPSYPAYPSRETVTNNYKIDCDEAKGSFNTLDTFVVHSLFIKKTVEKATYLPGETINYTIVYGNGANIPADNVTIYDVLPPIDTNNSLYVEFEGAEPAPTATSGRILFWNIGTLSSRETRTIHLYVRILENCSELVFKSDGLVSGKGYVYFRQRLSNPENRLTNYANITGYYLGMPETKNSSAMITLFGNEVKTTGHGSGSYRREEETVLQSENRSISVKTSLSEKYSPSNFTLPNGRSMDYNSKWSEAQETKNHITGASIDESYRYANFIERNSSIFLDKNGSTLRSETSFEGAGHLGVLKKPCDRPDEFGYQKAVAVYESQEDYLGRFTVTNYVDEYGQNVVTARNASGTGFVSSDKRIGRSQRSFESGTGVYSAEDRLETQTNYIARNISVIHHPVSYAYTPDVRVSLSKKWEAGLWSRSGALSPKGSNSSEPASFIGELFSEADYLKENAVVLGLNEMDTEAEFSGRAQFTAAKHTDSKTMHDDLALYDEYIGKYKISRKTMISGVAKYDMPHLNVSKVGMPERKGGTFVDYIIIIENDGNRALGPVYVLDLFPPGTAYVYSSLRPSERVANSVRWTLASLGIGQSTRIDLKLNRTRETDNVVNRVEVRGGYGNRWAEAENYSVVQISWLSCCPPQLHAKKESYVDPKDATMVHNRIILENRQRETMVATVIDDLAGQMILLNSSVQPSQYSSEGEVTWKIIDLQPGENRTIDYLTRSLESGNFVDTAHVVAHYLNGTEAASLDVQSEVNIAGGMYQRINGWYPPSCFGLNCTQQGFGNEWMPCYSCGVSDPETPASPCASCPLTEESTEGYQLP